MLCMATSCVVHYRFLIKALAHVYKCTKNSHFAGGLLEKDSALTPIAAYIHIDALMNLNTENSPRIPCITYIVGYYMNWPASPIIFPFLSFLRLTQFVSHFPCSPDNLSLYHPYLIPYFQLPHFPCLLSFRTPSSPPSCS